MTGTKVKRSQVRSFLNTGTTLSPVWSLIGGGAKTAEVAYNPEVTKETYIVDDNATVSIDSYGPTMAIEEVARNGDPVFEWLDALRKVRGDLEAAEAQVVNVWVYETPALGYYDAELQNVSVQIDKFGGDGGQPARISYTINYMGDPIQGTFSPTDLTFVADPINTILTTLVIGAVTLTPLFSANHANLWYAGSVAASSVTMSSTLAGATIVQKDTHGNTVGQGSAAALDMGVNHLTVAVTVGSETSTYHIDVTRTA